MTSAIARNIAFGRSRSLPVDVLRGALSTLGFAVFLLATRDGARAWGGDNAMYLMHARNRVTGQAYNATGYIQNPCAFLAPQAYPPGFPLILAPAYALMGLNAHRLSCYTTVIYVLAVAAFAGLIRSDMREVRAGLWAWLGLIWLVALNPVLVDRLTRIFGVVLLLAIPIFELLRCHRLTYAGEYRRALFPETPPIRNAPNGPAAMDMSGYIRRRTPANAVFLFYKPRVLAPLGERHAASYRDSWNRMPPDPRLFEYMHSIGVDYVLVNLKRQRTDLRSLLRRHASDFDLVYENRVFQLYRVATPADG